MIKNGKIVGNTKAKPKHGTAYYVIGGFTFAIESMLGINGAFLVDQSVSIVAENMLRGTFLEPLATLITLVVSLAVGFCFVFGGMWVFGGFMNSLDDVRAYQEEYKTSHWPERMVWLLMFAVVALDFTTLLFRASYFAEKGAVALFAFFVILIFMPPLLGPLVYVLEHTPKNRRLAKARNLAETLVTDDAIELVGSMDADLRALWLEDDTSALTEHKRRQEARAAEQRQIEQAQAAEKAAGQAAKNRPLPLASGQ